MTLDGKMIAGLSAALVALLLVPVAKADSIVDFSVTLTSGTNAGTVTGTIDLPFGSGSGAAASVVLTSLPSGFGTLVGGDTVTSWLNQVVNSFTVAGGTITAYEFGADTGPVADGTSDYFALNNTSGSTTDGGWFFAADYDALDAQGGNVFGQISSATAVTFTSASAVPETSTSSLMLMGLGSLGLMVIMRKRRARV